MSSDADRLQKVLAQAGLGSRRACEELILQGRVTVNGEVVRELGSKANPDATITVDGESIRREKPVYLAVCKPKGYVSTNEDPSGRPRVVDLVGNVPERVYTVGRLDEDSTGLMILTNDGELANRLAHPRYGVEKVYRAVVAGNPAQEVLEKLAQGVWLAEGKARAKRVRVVGRQGDATIVEMVLSEGKNREVRRMWAKLGHKVMSLSRVAIGPITVKGLKPGQSRTLTPGEVNDLRRLSEGHPVPTAWYGPDDKSRRPERPRRGEARHLPAPAARSADSEAPRRGERPMGPRGDRPARPMGPRADAAGPRPPRPAGPRTGTVTGTGTARPQGPRAGTGPSRPMGPRAASGSGPARPMGPRAASGSGPARPMGPRAASGSGPARPMGPRAASGPGPARPLGPRGGSSSGPPGPSGMRPRPPRDGGLTGPKRAKPRPQIADDGIEEIEVTGGPGMGPRGGRPTGRPSSPSSDRPRRGRPPTRSGGDDGPPLAGRIIVGMDAERLPPPSQRKRPPMGPAAGGPPQGGPKRRPKPTLRLRRSRPGGSTPEGDESS